MIANSASMYHYCNRAVWKTVNQGHRGYTLQDPKTGEFFDGERFQGLWPGWRLVETGPGSELVPPEATKPALFGFNEPIPRSWVVYRDAMNVFDYLMSCCADKGKDDDETNLILLEVELLPEDNPFVVDYVHVRHMARDFGSEPKSEAKGKIKAEGMKRYWESKVPLADYDGSFTLPEVVTWFPVPKERIHFIWEKNLHGFLDAIHGDKEAQSSRLTC